MKKNKFIYIVIPLLIINVSSLLFLFFQLGKTSSLKSVNNSIDYNSTGNVIVQVIDDFTNEPIEGATVCILETRHYEMTNKYGSTNSIEVPIIKNKNFDLYLKRTWGEITVLVYKNGYADNISFYNLIMPNTTRAGLIIRMKEIINSEDNSPTISLNKPTPEWTETLIKLYKKRI